MARCPYCNHILQDAWVKRAGAALMGKASGQSKARTKEQARAAGVARWRGKNKKAEQEEKEFSELRTLAGVRQPKRKT